MLIINMRPPRIGMALAFIAAALHWSFRVWEPTWLSMPRTGITIGIAGFALMMWSWGLFKQQHLAVCVTGISGHITKVGPYRFSRNPMYLGMVLMTLGLAVYVGTVPFYLSAIAYFLVLNLIFCPYEESKLFNAFGDEYALYKQRVRRWI